MQGRNPPGTEGTMNSKSGASVMPEDTSKFGIGRDAAVTRSLLLYGVVAGPLYLVVGLAQPCLRDGCDRGGQPLSLLANGPGGWVQTANFVVSGLMVLAAAVGIVRMPGPRSRALSWFLGGFGASMLVAAV